MTEKRSILENLLHRRVPQLVGMYIAATWLVIELGDWTTARFNMPATLTSYIFVAMLALLPAVILFSYNHGAPGKDQWTTSERVAIPLNALVAVGILYFLSPILDVEAATETVRIPDETGTIQEFEVAKSGYHKEVISFFWRNESGDGELDWLSYGLPLMLAHDLNRVSPVITVDTPFDSASVRNELRNKGYPTFLDEPQGLRVAIARDRRSAALIVGSFAKNGETITVNATLFDATSGNEIGSHSVSGSDWLIAIDDVSAAVLSYLDIRPSDNQSDDPIGQHFSNSVEAVKHFTNGQVAVDINNDYSLGIVELQRAVVLDPEFAEASGDLSMSHYLNNDLPAARETASEALRNSYRLSETSKFLLKANRYIYDGDFERGARVIEIWTQVQPNSTDAFGASAQINRLRGSAESLQMASLAYDRLLELDPQNLGILRQKAEVEQQRGDYESAALYLRNFLEQEPDSSDGHLQLAGVYQALGDLEEAQNSLEDATILSDNPLESELGLARLEARRGNFEEAEARLMRQISDDLSPQQQVQLLSARSEVAYVKGQIEKTITLNAEINEAAKAFMPPIARLLGIENQQSTMLVLLGRNDEAIAVADKITAQLQAPLNASMNFTYTTIYDAANDRETYQAVVDRTLAVQDQISPIFEPFIEMQLARLAVWDEDYDQAAQHLERSGELLGRSFIQVFQNNLSSSSIHVMLAELFFEANDFDESRERLEEILKVFPSNGHAKLVYAKVLMAQGDAEAGRKALVEALEIWTDADADFIYRQESASLLSRL
ncbi:MAG: tetratricopeptide repeat protein [Woeseiaceae bacterium]